MFDRMRISKTLIFIIVSALVSVVLSSCSDNNEPEILPDDSEDYCLMYYCSGGDPAHDLSFMSAIESAATVTNPKVSNSRAKKKEVHTTASDDIKAKAAILLRMTLSSSLKILI